MATTSFFALPGAPDPEENALTGLIASLNDKVTEASVAAADAATSAEEAAISANNALTSANATTNFKTSLSVAANGLSAGSTPTVTYDPTAIKFTFGIPAGATGATGPQGPTGPAGSQGLDGAAATVSVGTVTTGAAGSSASVTNAGTSSAAVLNFTIPRGDVGATGPQGAAGAAATISVGTVTTGSQGSSATVTNVGTSSAAVFNFSIPKGDTGTGDISGPASATNNNIAVFDGATGKLIKDGGTPISSLATVSSLSSYLTTSAAASTYQPIDGDLTSIAGLAGTSGLLKKTAANTWTLDTSTYLTSYTETDPVYSASPAAGITSTKISNWDTAYGWGNHASAGYLTTSSAASTYQPLDGDLTSIAGLAGTTGFLKKTAANTWSLDTSTYQTQITASGILKGDGAGSVSAATANTDYVSPTGADGTLTRWMLKDTGWEYFNSGTTNALDYTNGSYQRWTPTAASSPTLSISNWPPSGDLGELLIEAVGLASAGTISFPTANWIKSDGTLAASPSAAGVTFQTGTGIDFIMFWTRDAGTTLYAKVIR